MFTALLCPAGEPYLRGFKAPRESTDKTRKGQEVSDRDLQLTVACREKNKLIIRWLTATVKTTMSSFLRCSSRVRYLLSRLDLGGLVRAEFRFVFTRISIHYTRFRSRDQMLAAPERRRRVNNNTRIDVYQANEAKYETLKWRNVMRQHACSVLWREAPQQRCGRLCSIDGHNLWCAQFANIGQIGIWACNKISNRVNVRMSMWGENFPSNRNIRYRVVLPGSDCTCSTTVGLSCWVGG